MGIRRGWGVALLLLAGCAGRETGWWTGGRVVEVVPGPSVKLAWARMQVCLGREGRIEDWRWFVADTIWYVTPMQDTVPALGLTMTDPPRIYLKRGAGLDVLHHEILHALGLAPGESPAHFFCIGWPHGTTPR